MDEYVDLCRLFGLPVWIAPLLHAAKHLKSDQARRRKVYKLIQRTMRCHMENVKGVNLNPPTYVYPKEVKLLVRSVFSENICDYPDPCHDQVVYLTVEDLHNAKTN